MSQGRLIIHISSTSVSRLGSVIVLDTADEDEAKKIAQALAQKTGRRVTVWNEKRSVIATIPGRNYSLR
jgi:hypothetical protein